MTEITRAYEFVVMLADGTTPDLTFTDPDFAGAAPPTYGGWRVNVLEGDSESEPFTVSILDTSEQVTANLSDAGGRADLMGRVWRLRVNEDGGGLTTVAQGRIVGVQLSSSVAAYDFQCGDEQHWTRGRVVYRTVVTPTTQFYPPGLRSLWYNTIRTAPTIGLEARDVSDPDKIGFTVISAVPISEDMVAWLQEDLKEDADIGGITGNFNTLRINIGGTDREITSLNIADSQAVLYDIENIEGEVHIYNIWVAFASHGVGAETFFFDVFLHNPNSEPSKTVPLHIGGTTFAGVDLIQELKDRYVEEGVRFDTNAFDTWDATTNPTGLIAHPDIPPGHLRITEPLNLAKFEQQIFKSRGLAPFPNSSGEITPRFLKLPDTTNPSALTQITVEKLRGTHPTWQQLGNEIITVVNASYEIVRQMPLSATRDDSSWPADQIVLYDAKPAVFEHDRVADLGRFDYNIEMFGLYDAFARLYADSLQEEVFNRYGDGPVRGKYSGMSALDGVAAGDFVVIDLSSYPNLDLQARGGPRLVQVLEISRTPFGADFEYLDAGKDDDALAAPGVAIIKTVADPKHSVDVTISSLPAGSTYLLQLKVGSDEYRTYRTGTANETVSINNLPSGTLITPRVKAIIVAQVSSLWATVAGVTLTALAAPSAVTATATGRTIELVWTNNEADEGVMPTLDGVDFLDTPLTPGTARWVFTGLAASTLFTCGVKAVDEQGGESTIASDTATTGTADTLVAPTRLEVLQGAPTTGDIDPIEPVHGTGIEYGIRRSDSIGEIEFQVSTSSTHATIESKTVLKDGESVQVTIPLDDTIRYCRARAVREGFTSSAFTATVAAKPIAFVLKPPPPPTVEATAQRIRSTGFIADAQTKERDVELIIGAGTKSLEFDYSFVRVTTAVPSTLFDVDYSIDTTLGDTRLRHTIEDGLGSAQVFISKNDSGTTRNDSNFFLTVTPFSEVGGAGGDGVAGVPVSIEVDRIGTTDDVGAKVVDGSGQVMPAGELIQGTNVTFNWRSDGQVEINVGAGAGASLDDLSDVNITTALEGQILYRNATEFVNLGTLTIRDDGSAGAPAYSYLSEPGLGVYRVSADLLGVAGSLQVDNAGPHAIGGAVTVTRQLHLRGAFSAASPTGMLFGTALTANAGSSTIDNVLIEGTAATAAAADVYSRIASLNVTEPNISLGAGSSVTDAVTVFISGAPTEGVNNYALLVAGGLTQLQDVRVADGSAGAPTYSFADDDDTGVFRVTANHMGLVAGGLTRLAVVNTHVYVTSVPFVSGSATDPANLVSGDILASGGVFATSDAGASDIDHLYHDDTNNEWRFVSDAARKAVGNSRLQVGDGTAARPAMNFGSDPTTGWLLDGAATLAASVSAAIQGRFTVDGLSVSDRLVVGTATHGANLAAGDILANDGVFATGDAGASDIDHIHHDDATNTWHFCSDTTRKATGNSTITPGLLKLNNDGTRTIPSMAYVSETGLGFWRNSARVMGLSADELRLSDDSATGDPFLSFYQTTNRVALIQFLDSGNILVLDSEESATGQISLRVNSVERFNITAVDANEGIARFKNVQVGVDQKVAESDITALDWDEGNVQWVIADSGNSGSTPNVGAATMIPGYTYILAVEDGVGGPSQWSTWTGVTHWVNDQVPQFAQVVGDWVIVQFVPVAGTANDVIGSWYNGTSV